MQEVLIYTVFLDMVDVYMMSQVLLHVFGHFLLLFCLFYLYRFKNISWSKNVKVLKMMPKFLLAVFTLELMWSLNVRFLSIITPRSFAFSTFSSSTS